MNSKGALHSLIHLSMKEVESLKRDETFYCPDCKQSLFIRYGERTIPHFVHYHQSNCLQNGESAYHELAKYQLYAWLKSQFPRVVLEYHLQTINQYPDIYVETDKHKIACEFQSARIANSIIKQRNAGYEQIGIQPIWFIGFNQLKQRNMHSIYINTFLKQFIYQFHHTFPPTLYTYCPKQRAMIVWSDLYLLQKHAYGKQTIFSLRNTLFTTLFSEEQLMLSGQRIFLYWQKEKQNFRLNHRRNVYGKELEWRNWLYNKGYFIENLPSIIHLPIKEQYKVCVPLWNWQSRFVIDFFQPLHLYQSFTLEHAIQPFHALFLPSLDQQQTKHPIASYLQYFVQLGYVKQTSKTNYVKLDQLTFPEHIEQALQADQWLLSTIQKDAKDSII